MDSQEVGLLLAECLAAAQQAAQPTEADRLNYCSCRDLLCAEVASLLQEAMDMKWPFMPEKWQYKQTVSDKDKTNLSDLISKHLSQLLAVLKASIVAHDAGTALALVFLVDRFLYWTDESSRLLTITKLLHRRHPDTPVAPQLVIRQARIYLNSGKLQKAEYILGSLINNSGATGVWVYQSESDRALVQAVSVQVRGMILQKLGLWLEAAELIWASLVGYYALPQPDKKGIGTSLGILANILVSMNDADFHTFRTNPDIDLTLLGGGSHRLLSAAQAAKMAVVYSQYTSLYVLTNVTTQGTCLLAYCFSLECPASQRQTFLLQAREAFTIGLLTKAKDELVTSKQELHTFLKAAYSLTVAHKWLGTPLEVVAQATQACQKALACFYEYSNADSQNKDSLCAEIMHLVAQVKCLLHVEPFLNSDKGSFIPDSYRNSEHSLVKFTLESFDKVMKRFQKYHASLCEINTNSKGTKDEVDGTRLTITALWTTFSKLNTECSTEACLPPKGEEPQLRGSNSPALSPPQQLDLCPTLGSTDDLGSSWDKFSLSSSGSSMPGSFTGSRAIERETNLNQSWPTTEFNDDNSDSRLKSTNKNMHPVVSSHTVPRYAMPATSSSNASHNSEKFELMQAGAGEAALSLSELALRTSSSSLNDSFGSHSSWEKISADSPTNRKPQPNGLSRAGMGQSSKSLSDSDESFFRLETVDSETCQSPCDPTNKNHTSGWDLFNPQPPKSLHVDPNMDKQADSVSVKPVNKDFVERPNPNISPEQCDVTENSTCSLFEILEENPSGHQGSEVTSSEKVNAPHMKNPLCYSCLEHSITNGVVPESQHFLSQQDYQALLAGVCHECLVKRLHSDKTQFKLKTHRAAYSALHLKFSKATGLWTARETCAYIGEPMDKKGNQRMAIWVQFLHQEERLSSYVGKDYLKPRGIQFHLKDVERQMTAQYYVTEFNKSLYNKEVMAQIFFIPSEALLLLNGNEIAGCVTVEPYMPGHFVKLTNNKEKKEISFQATEYGLAFGHFTYLFSNCQEVVVDLQGWVTANGKGLTYLTDPQIHSTKIPKGPSNFGARGLKHFLEDQHGPDCNGICRLLKLPPFVQQQHGLPQKL